MSDKKAVETYYVIIIAFCHYHFRESHICSNTWKRKLWITFYSIWWPHSWYVIKKGQIKIGDNNYQLKFLLGGDYKVIIRHRTYAIGSLNQFSLTNCSTCSLFLVWVLPIQIMPVFGVIFQKKKGIYLLWTWTLKFGQEASTYININIICTGGIFQLTHMSTDP